jgi:hypothetical protein
MPNLIEDIPEDLIIVLTDTLCEISKVSIVMLAHVNKFCYQISRSCAVRHKIDKKLKHSEIVADGSLNICEWVIAGPHSWTDWYFETCDFAANYGNLDILKWARSNNYFWDSYTLKCAAKNGHIDVLKWAKSNGCSWNNSIQIIAEQKWPNEFL